MSSIKIIININDKLFKNFLFVYIFILKLLNFFIYDCKNIFYVNKLVTPP